jgi:hypothetical protein
MAFKSNKDAAECGKKSKRGKSKKTEQWERMGEFILIEGTEKYIKHLKTLDGKEFAFEFRSILEYFQPKQIRSENNNKNENIVTVIYGNKEDE